MIDFLAGAVTLGYTASALFFLRFWRKTRERLFLAFAVSFALLALNQGIAAWLEAGSERTAYVYTLRVLGFVLILWAIIDKNTRPRKFPKR